MPTSPIRQDQPRPPATARVMARLLPWARPALPRTVAGALGALGASLLALAVPQVLRVLVNGPLLTAGTLAQVVQAAALVLVLGVAEAVLVWSRRVLVVGPATGVEFQIRSELFRHLLDLPIAFHDRTSGGQLLSRIMNDLSAIRRWLAFGVVMLVVSSVTILVGGVLMAATAGPLALVYFAGAIPMVWLGFRFRADYAMVARRARDQAGDLATTVEESIHGIRVLKAFGRGQDALDDFVAQADQLRQTEIAKARTLSRVVVALTAIPEVVLALSLGLGIWLVASGQLSVGALVAFFATAAVMNRPLEQLANLLAMTLDARAATDRVLDVMDTVPGMTDPPSPASLPVAGPAGTTVEFRGVGLRYPGAEQPVLEGVDLILRPGRTTALVGSTGSGKTSLLLLVPRLYEATAGAVLIDGVDVRDVTRHELRGCVATAFEDPVLFSASVRDNVLLGVAQDDPRREERLVTALRTAQAHFVWELPDGVDTVVGEQGMSLSGGQRQRLALARAIAAEPRVLVLDDPLSALDVTTEAAVTAELKRVLPGTTTLVVAHRPSTVALADRVAVLENGRITGLGSHTELLATHPHYRFVLTARTDRPRALDEEVGVR